MKEQKAQAFYPDTKETEDLDLGALVRAQEISLIELRKPDDPVNEGETVLDGPDHLEQIGR